MEDAMSAYDNTKPAWMWVHPIHPYCVGYPGVVAELFFSSPAAFDQLLGRHRDPTDNLVEVTVPADFNDWDFIPENY
jgi:hypothetical protein